MASGDTRNSILVDASLNLSGISSESIGKIKKEINSTILSNNELKLNFDKNGNSALINQLEVVYDKVNKINKVIASVKMGDTNYKFNLNDMTNARKEVLSLNRQIANTESKINDIQSKRTKLTKEEKDNLKELKNSLSEKINKRNAYANNLIIDKDLQGKERYQAKNLRGMVNTKTQSSTKLLTDEQKIINLYKEKEKVIKRINTAIKVGATAKASAMKKEELSLLDSKIKRAEDNIRKKHTPEMSNKIIDTAKGQLKGVLAEQDIIKESQAVKNRQIALNDYEKTLKEIYKVKKSLAMAEGKFNDSARNRTQEALDSINAQKNQIKDLELTANKYLDKTKVRTKGEVSNGKEANEYNEALKKQAVHIQNVKTAQAEANAVFGKSNNVLGIMRENFKQAAARIIDYTIVYRSLWLVMQKVQQGIQTVIELNKAFTDIQMVTGYTDKQIKNLETSYSKLAKSMGATVHEVASGATEWLRQGKSVSATNELIKQSMILSKTGAMDSAKATEKLTSTLNGYKMSVEDASRVVDVFSKLDMITASSVDELATAFTRTANSANDAGIPFENLAGLIATVSETTRKSASSIGESIKTLTARYSNVKIGKFVDDETGEAINDTEKVLNKLNIKMRESNDEWRDMWDVMNEIGTQWENFTQLEKNAIVVSQAGVRQAENLRATYANWDKVLKNVGEAYNSAGYSAQKYSVYLDGIEGRTKTMIATYQDLVSNPVFENLIKNIISLVTGFGELLDKVGLSNIAFVGITVILTKVAKAISGMVVSMVALSAGIEASSLKSISLIATIKNVATALTTAGGAAALFSTALSAVAPFAIVAGIVAVTYAVMNHKTALEKATDAMKEYQGEQEEAEASIEALSAAIDDNKSKWLELEGAKAGASDISKIQSEQEALEEENETLKAQKEYYEAIAAVKKEKAKEKAREILNSTEDIPDTGPNRRNKSDMRGGKNKAKPRASFKNPNISEIKTDPITKAEDYANKLQQYNTKSLELYKEYANATTDLQRKEIQKQLDNVKSSAERVENSVGDLGLMDLLKVFDEADPEYKKIIDANSKLSKGLNASAKITGFLSDKSQITTESIDELSTAINTESDEIDDLGDATKSYVEIINKFSESITTLESAKNELSEDGFLSWNTISSLIEAFPELTNELLKYTQGAMSSKDVMNLLNNAIEKQQGTFKDNISASKDYYQKMVLSNEDMYNKFLENYNIDLTNYTSIQQLKAAVDAQRIADGTKEEADRINKMAEYYNIDLANFGDVTSKKLQMQKFLTASIEKEKSNAAKYGRYIPGGKDGETYTLKQKEMERDLGNLGIIGSTAEIDGYIKEIESLASGITKKVAASVGKKSKSSEDKWKEAFDKEYKTLQYWKDKEWITEKEYYDKLEKLNNKYFKDKSKYVDEFRQYDLEVENGRLSVYQDLFKKRLELSEKYINDKMYYDNWGSDSEIQAWTRVLKWMKDEFYPQSKKQKEVFDQYYKDATKSLISAIESEFDKTLDSSSHQRDIFKFQTGNIDISSIEKDMDKIAEVIKKGYYEVNGELVDLTKERYESLQKQWMSLYQERVSYLENEKDKMEDVVGAATNIIDKQKEQLEVQKDNVSQMGNISNYILELNRSKYQALMGNEHGVANALQEQIDYIREQQSIINNITDEEEKRKKIREVQLEIQRKSVAKLKEELNIIKGQKNQRIYSAEKGWYWSSDKQAELDKEQEILEKETEVQESEIQNQIDNWEDYKKAWTDVVENYKLEQDKLLLAQKLGRDAEKDILNQRIDIVDEFAKRYEDIMNQISEYQDTINNSSNIEVPSDITRPTDENSEDERRDAVISQMKKNSEDWFNASDEDRKRLSKENDRLGNSIDAYKDSYTGKWYYSKDEVVSQMNSNSRNWHSASKSEQNRLSAENQRLGNLIDAKYNSQNGTWTYHDGIENGLVGGVPFDKNSEILAKLALKEGVFNPEQMKNMVTGIRAMVDTSPSYKNNSANNNNSQVIHIGNISLPNVDDANGFIDTMRNIVAISGNN